MSNSRFPIVLMNRRNKLFRQKLYAESPSRINFRKIWASALQRMAMKNNLNKQVLKVWLPISDIAFSNKKRYSLLFPQGPLAVAICLKKKDEVDSTSSTYKLITNKDIRQEGKKRKSYEDHLSPCHLNQWSWAQVIPIGFFVHCWYKSEI